MLYWALWFGSTSGHQYWIMSSGRPFGQQAAGLMTLAELGLMLESTRRMAEAEIAALAAQEDRVEELERDRDALLEFYAGAVPEALDQLDGERRTGSTGC